MAPFVVGIGLGPLGPPNSSGNKVKPVSFGVPFEINVIPEQRGPRFHIRLQTSGLEAIYVDEPIWVYLS